MGQGRGTRGKGQGRGQEKDGENVKPMKVKKSFKGKERWGAEQTDKCRISKAYHSGTGRAGRRRRGGDAGQGQGQSHRCFPWLA